MADQMQQQRKRSRIGQQLRNACMDAGGDYSREDMSTVVCRTDHGEMKVSQGNVEVTGNEQFVGHETEGEIDDADMIDYDPSNDMIEAVRDRPYSRIALHNRGKEEDEEEQSGGYY